MSWRENLLVDLVADCLHASGSLPLYCCVRQLIVSWSHLAAHECFMSRKQWYDATLGEGAASEWQSVLAAVMGSLPAEVRRKKVLPFFRLFFQSPDMESQVARCMAQQFPNVLSQVLLPPLGAS